MRLELLLHSPQPIPFDHLPTLKGAFHRWSGHSPELHDAVSLYSLSWLRGGQAQEAGIRFPKGAAWSISAHDPAVLQTILHGIQAAPELPDYGLQVVEATIRRPPALAEGQHEFRVLSPVLVKQPRDRATEYLRYDHPAAGQVLTQVLHHKLRTAGLPAEGAEVTFSRHYPSPKTKLFRYGQVQCRANLCPVTVRGTAEQLAFAWCVGVGHSTGIGCGALD